MFRVPYRNVGVGEAGRGPVNCNGTKKDSKGYKSRCGAILYRCSKCGAVGCKTTGCENQRFNGGQCSKCGYVGSKPA